MPLSWSKSRTKAGLETLNVEEQAFAAEKAAWLVVTLATVAIAAGDTKKETEPHAGTETGK
eukprot:CAMPEP_0175126330 /NCGR_PEP_ID=MMETSP0087-20121206/3790_1 /TAXON_ID=136419 /ORGANISM="Unknown Unknown, Strain D1" /LENGTH=60 /DNA_ID=CAMNT_0016408223 /DNA_START=757 /DNA_END=939 /DNA_ORIENTATION=+